MEFIIWLVLPFILLGMVLFNYLHPLDIWSRPGALSSPSLVSFTGITHIIGMLTVSILAFFVYGIWIALIFAVVLFVLGRITARYFFKKAIKLETNKILEDNEEPESDPSEAHKTATDIVNQRTGKKIS